MKALHQNEDGAWPPRPGSLETVCWIGRYHEPFPPRDQFRENWDIVIMPQPPEPEPRPWWKRLLRRAD